METRTSTQPTTVKAHKFKFNGTFGEVFGLILKNTILTILTLGLYIPYARTNMRKYIWRSSSLSKKPFLFHADPRNLMKGYLVMGISLIAVSAMAGMIQSMFVTNLVAQVVAGLLPKILIFYFIIRSRFGAYAYLVRNTSYRSIRFNVDQDAGNSYIKTMFKGTILSVLTLGIYYPFMASQLARIKWSNTSYGDRYFKYKAEDSEYAKIWFKGVFLSIVTLGLYLPWFMASMHKFNITHIRFEGAKFGTKITGREYLILMLKSFFLITISLGLAAPYILNMNLAFILDNLMMKGDLDFEEITQSSKSSKDMSMMDGVADVFDVDVA